MDDPKKEKERMQQEETDRMDNAIKSTEKAMQDVNKEDDQKSDIK